MKKIVLPNGEISLVEPSHILQISFIGDINERSYKNIWETALKKAVELNCNNFLFDQSRVGKVNFSARVWLALKMIPRIKKELGLDLKVSLIPSKKTRNKADTRFLIKMYEKIGGSKVIFYPDLETVRKEKEKSQLQIFSKGLNQNII